MGNCASCGYQTNNLKQTPTGSYCKVCVAIGAPQINEKPNAFGDSKYFIPPLAWCTNYILAAIATRVAANETDAAPASSATEDGAQAAYIVLSEDGQLVEVQDPNGKPIEMPESRMIEVEGTSFKKFAVNLPGK